MGAWVETILCPVCGRVMPVDRAEEIGICLRCEKDQKDEVWKEILRRKAEDGEREE